MAHAMLVEIGHLLLYGTVDAGVARVETDDEVTTVVVTLHELKLLVEIHAGTAPHDTSLLGACGELTRHKAASVEDEVGTLKKLPSSHTDEVGVARTCTHYLYVSLPFSSAI